MSINKTLHLYQYKDGYRYNSDSLLLYDFSSKLDLKGNVLDVGSGSGILGLLLKRDFSNISLTQIEVQDAHKFLTCKNANYNNLESEIICADFINYKFDKKFDYIVSNPPFYHKGTQKSENELLKISRHSDYLPFEKLTKSVSSNLKPKGSFLFCYDAKQVDVLLETLLKYKLKVNAMRFVHTKQNKDASIVLIHAKNSSKTLCKVFPPLYMDSNEVEKIYLNSKTESLLWEN